MANSRNYASTLGGKANVTGKKIQKYREKQNISKQELSNRLMILGTDISAKSIYHIEAGTRTVTDFEICAIASVLNVPIQEFLSDYCSSLVGKTES